MMLRSNLSKGLIKSKLYRITAPLPKRTAQSLKSMLEEKSRVKKFRPKKYKVRRKKMELGY